MKKKPIINTFVVAISVVALAAAAMFFVTSRQHDAVSPLRAAQASQDRAPSVGTLVGGLEARLDASPDDAKGWILLARSYEHLGDHDRAWYAYSRARDLGMTDSALELKLATHVVSAIGQ